ncbi:MAG: hypothetical protein NT051_01740 [Candidatus Micrarchaeota archaeon]|nr:hypothetical protein [Candidatus Micrarchaeota archaeon]
MGILYHERRMGMQNGDHAWKDYLGNSNTDAIEKVNEINGLFFPKLARHMKHPLPHNSELVCIKLGQVAQEIFQQGYGKNAQVVFDELMNCSIRIKRWCEEDKIRLHVREIEGKKTIGFNFPNYDGTKGGFVAASCHFHNAGQIFVHDSAMVLGHTCFARHVTIYRSTIIDCYHLENVFISNSILKNVRQRSRAFKNSGFADLRIKNHQPGSK